MSEAETMTKRERKPKPASAYWDRGRLVDGREPPSAPWSRVLGVLALLLLVDLFLSLGQPPPASHTPDTRAALQEILTTAAADPGRSVLLIGDSVLAGDVMAAQVADWDQQRVVDHMEVELGREAEVGLHQIALDGLLPVDLEHVVAELDRVDPKGRVELVLELNLRYFSDAYREQLECSREALCELAPHAGENPGGAVASLWRSFSADVRWIDDRLHAIAPVHRQRASFHEIPRLDRVDGLAVARTSAAPKPASVERVEGENEGRVLEHYRSAAITADNVQVAALRRTLTRLHHRGRKTVIFVTPLEDTFAELAAPEPELGGLHSDIAALVHDLADPRLRLVDLDHPLFVSDLFIDHCHLWPEGNRLLALNLLHELSIPMRARPPETAMVVPEDFDQTLVARVDRGYAEGAAWQALFNAPDGVDVSRDGSWIVVADTHNHMLRQLRGDMRVVEPLAGTPLRRGRNDGEAIWGARLDRPRHPTIIGDSVVFVDGRERDRVRVVDSSASVGSSGVRTLKWKGPRCTGVRRLRSRDGWLYMLCNDGRVLNLKLVGSEVGAELRPSGSAHQLLAASTSKPGGEGEPGRAHRFEIAPEGRLLFSDPQQRIWEAKINADKTALSEPPRLTFANTSKILLPSKKGVTFPFTFDEIGLANIADLRWVERYGGLLVADEHPLDPPKRNQRLESELTERVHLRFFDLEARKVYPWVKPIPHGEAYGMWNEKSRSAVSYYHRGSFVVAQDDASLIWIEHGRSRLFRIADGFLGLIKFGNRNSWNARVKLYDAIGNIAPDEALAAYSPHRFFDARFEPFEREGPYLALMVGSSLTTLVDRVGNYSLGRRLELELQRELGYRDNIRFDLLQRTAPSASFSRQIGMIDELISAGVRADVIFVEVHDHGGRFFRKVKTQDDMFEQLARLEKFAAQSDALVVLFDNTALDADGRDGLRATNGRIHGLLDAARQLGFVVIEPSDRLLRELLVESPWGTQPWGREGHHGAPYAIDRTAELLSALVYPAVRAHLLDRTPARLRIRSDARKRGTQLASAFTEIELRRGELPEIAAAYLQQSYEDGHVHLFVDLSGFKQTDTANLDRVAAAVLIASLEHEAYGNIADQVTVTLVEYDNYDEYGEGVLESAANRWERSFDVESLTEFLLEVAGG